MEMFEYTEIKNSDSLKEVLLFAGEAMLRIDGDRLLRDQSYHKACGYTDGYLFGNDYSHQGEFFEIRPEDFVSNKNEVSLDSLFEKLENDTIRKLAQESMLGRAKEFLDANGHFARMTVASILRAVECAYDQRVLFESFANKVGRYLINDEEYILLELFKMDIANLFE